MAAGHAPIRALHIRPRGAAKTFDGDPGRPTFWRLANAPLHPRFRGTPQRSFRLQDPHHPDYQTDRHERMVDVGLSTAAVPTYFRPLEHGGYVLVDGGVWANNATMLAVIEALPVSTSGAIRSMCSVSAVATILSSFPALKSSRAASGIGRKSCSPPCGCNAGGNQSDAAASWSRCGNAHRAAAFHAADPHGRLAALDARASSRRRTRPFTAWSAGRRYFPPLAG